MPVYRSGVIYLIMVYRIHIQVFMHVMYANKMILQCLAYDHNENIRNFELYVYMIIVSF